MTVQITYYSDVLCVWAYTGETRLAKLHAQFGDDVEVEHRFCSVFGNTAEKIGHGWKDRGGYEGFAAHVHEVAARFDTPLHPDLWLKVRPASSDPAHVLVKASQIVEARGELDAGGSERLLTALRVAFFRDAKDVASWSVQEELVGELGLPVEPLQHEIQSGAAFAALASDAQGKIRWHVLGSPTLLLNDGRQKLYGNVGYRVVEANVRELLREPASGEASWC